MMRAIRNLIKLCRVSIPNNDTGNFPVSQIEYWEKTSQAVELYPYGMSAVAPENCLGYVFNVQGQEENKFFIAFPNSDIRHKGLKPGEVIFGNLLTGSSVLFKENGDIEVTGKTALNVNITGDANITSSGTINLNAGNVNVGGQGGEPIAREGDTIQVIVSGTPYDGVITSGSSKNRST